MSDEIREQIERLRASVGSPMITTEAADTMEKLLAVYEAAQTVSAVLDEGAEPNPVEIDGLAFAISSVQTRQQK